MPTLLPSFLILLCCLASFQLFVWIPSNSSAEVFKMHLAGGVYGRAKHWIGPRISLQLVECGEGVQAKPCHYPHQYAPTSISHGFVDVVILVCMREGTLSPVIHEHWPLPPVMDAYRPTIHYIRHPINPKPYLGLVGLACPLHTTCGRASHIQHPVDDLIFPYQSIVD